MWFRFGKFYKNFKQMLLKMLTTEQNINITLGNLKFGKVNEGKENRKWLKSRAREKPLYIIFLAKAPINL